jgi:type I restriction enzyme S subunit
MDLKPGYKQTEVGVIPADWDVKPLPEVCWFRSGKAHERFISDFGRFVCVNSKFISTDGEIRKYSTANFCPAKKGDVLLVMSDLPNGRALAKAYLVEQDDLYAVNQRVCALTAHRDCAPYLFYFLNRNRYFLKFDDGVNQTHLLNPVFLKCPVALPREIHEQRAIAAALTDMDVLLARLSRLIAKKRDLKQAAMNQLLTGKIRLPGFTDEWEVKRLDQLGTWKGGMTPSMQNPAFWLNGNIPWISSGDVKSVLLKETGFAITPIAVRQGVTTLLPEKSIVIVTRSGILRKYLPVAMNAVPMAINQDIKALIPAEKFCALFLLYALIAGGSRILASCMKTGTTVESVEFRWLQAFTIPVPQLPEQTAIADVLREMDAELAALEQRLAKTRALKQAMMQELLTGGTRLLSPEASRA